MNNELIELAHSKLLIHDILLHSGEIKTNDDFFPLNKRKTYKIQFKQHIKDSRVFRLDGADSQGPIDFILFHYVAGFRALPEGLSNEENESEISEEVEVEVVATFSATYRMIEKVPEEAIEEFARFNVGFNVWPFWREYATSTAARLGLPSFPIPLYRVPKVAKK